MAELSVGVGETGETHLEAADIVYIFRRCLDFLWVGLGKGQTSEEQAGFVKPVGENLVFL